jgi:hypothetical protein
MVRRQIISVCALLVGLGLLPAIAHATDCSGLPTSFNGNEFPSGDFFTNFYNNPCYMIPLGTGNGSTKYGDLNAIYYQIYFKVDPRYQLILVGTFPNARYFSVTLYDAHSISSQTILDTNIVPLTPNFVNPYQPGISFVGGQRYAVPVGFGGKPGKLETGCMMNGYNVNVNALDATQRHDGVDWNSDTAFFQQYPTFPAHNVDTPQHTNPNPAGVLLVRAFLSISSSNYDVRPHVIVRDVASGCAYPADYAIQTLQIVTDHANTGSSWLEQKQGYAHNFYDSKYLPQLCYGTPSEPSQLPWFRRTEYVPGNNPDASYILATVPSGLPAQLATAGEVMRIRFRVPTVPPTPCTHGCSRSGNEQMRYMSLSFLDPGGTTIASLADSAFTQDPNGYVTLIVGTGAAIPSWITAANGYSYLDLTAISGYDQLTLLDLRHIAPAGTFNCAGQVVPYRTAPATPGGSLMGDYWPVVDYPVASGLPTHADPWQGVGACASFPAGQPGARPDCAVLPPPPMTINSVVTECPAPGCNQFVAQPTPPITISGAGFGAFPGGTPFTGTSNYLQITDVTQNWRAGYTGYRCTVSISSWDDGQIQLVANVNKKGLCPLAAGDKLTIEVWNPQTAASATFRVTAAAQ